MLTDTETAMLDLERSWFKFPGAKDETIRDQFGLTPARYYATLDTLIDRPDAEAHDPATVRRLVRLREARRLARAG